MSLERRRQEIELLRKKYGQVEHGPNLDWVLFKQLPLPPGWNRQTTELLVILPPGYPTTPPDNFYVRNGLKLADGERMPNNYSEDQNILGGSWAQFSFHAERWNPSPGFEDGDSLITFLIAIEHRLQELN